MEKTLSEIIDELQQAIVNRDLAETKSEKYNAWQVVKKLKKEAIDAIVAENLQ